MLRSPRSRCLEGCRAPLQLEPRHDRSVALLDKARGRIVGLGDAAPKAFLKPGPACRARPAPFGLPLLTGAGAPGLTPLFILAPGRSFTSITCGMIGCHPQMFGLAEINLFAKETVGELQELYRARARLDNGLLRSLAELAFSEQTHETIEAVRGWLAENAEMSTGELFRTMQAWAGERGLVDKSPLYVFMPEALERIGITAPAAYYLHLTRHPGDTVKSAFQLRRLMRDKAVERFPALAKVMETRMEPDAPDKMWLQPHRAILAFLESIPAHRQMRLRGEDLLSDPPRHLAAIADWLGIASGKPEIDAMMHPETSPFAAYGPDNARFGNDPNFMESPGLRPYTYHPRPLEWEMPNGEVVKLSDTLCAYASRFGY